MPCSIMRALASHTKELLEVLEEGQDDGEDAFEGGDPGGDRSTKG